LIRAADLRGIAATQRTGDILMLQANARRGHRIFLQPVLAAAAALLLAAPAAARDESPGQWYGDGQAELQRALQRKPIEGPVKNIVLFVGDGMGISTVTAARIFDGQLRGESGEENSLAFEQLPYLALAKTYETDLQVPDSAGTMTAIMTGVKTKAGLIGLNQYASRGNCNSGYGKNLETLLEKAEKQGRSTGIVTTSRLTHATPAATFAHAADRDWESDRDIPEPERTAGCKDIARQLIEFPLGDGVDVALGGGRAKFLAEGQQGERVDGRDLIQDWRQKFPEGHYVSNAQQLGAIDATKADKLLGLFAASHMSYDKLRSRDADGEPSLVEMTRKAIEVLQKNPKGFFLMVEGGRIDHSHHAGKAFLALDETREFAAAVRTALSMTDSRETLLVVTADHGHVLTMAGYPKRGNPILGKVVGGDEAAGGDEPALALDERPYTTLGYANGPGAIAVHDPKSKQRARRDLGAVDTTAPDFLQQALVPLKSETHSGEDVPVYAGGPWAHLFQRTVEQNYVFHVMQHALNVPARVVPKKGGKAAGRR
jgi:alkaline phosphatase